jgi:Na+-transporting NADH:ubiquinone oxidoreductase subunit NqrB
MTSRLLCLALVSVVALACDDGPTSPVKISSGNSGSRALAVTGTWIGTATDSTRQMTMTWQLAQSDSNVTGTFTATTPVGAPIYTGGSIAGTVSATALVFTIAVPRGSVVDAADCTATFAGTADDVRADSMSGTYSGTDTCGGTFAGGRFTLLKQ